MHKRFVIYVFFSILVVLIWSFPAKAQRIRFRLGGAKYTGSGTTMSVSITADATTPLVVVGMPPDQMFRDDSVSAAFFGYYLTAGVRTQNQAPGTQAHVQLRRGSGATLNRTYYLIGNGVVSPSLESHLVLAPSSYTTIATAPRNRTRCGPNWSANGVTGGGVNCAANPTVAAMDVTQFVKVQFSDLPSSTIQSRIQFIVSVF